MRLYLSKRSIVPVISLSLLLFITMVSAIIFAIAFSKYVELRKNEELEREKAAIELALIDIEVIAINDSYIEIINNGGIPIRIDKKSPIDIFCYKGASLLRSQEFSNKNLLYPGNSTIIKLDFNVSQCDYFCVAYKDISKCLPNFLLIIPP